MGIIIIIILIILLEREKNKADKLLNENISLKEEIQKLKKTDSFEPIDTNKELDELSINETIFKNNEKILNNTKKEKIENENRNITILITGAILIVLSAIVFLMSTWYTIPNILKTLVLVLLAGVFFGGSRIAKEKFKLPKASMTFFYIAMAYIPICLFSISFLGLLGDYFSIIGDGNFIYLTISGCITAIIYYVIYKNKNTEVLFIGSILSQILSVILFTLIFSKKIELIILNLSLYNIVFMLLTDNIKSICYKMKNIYSIIPYTSCILAILIINEMTVSTILVSINFIILAINFIILETKQKNLIHALAFNISINIAGNYLFWNLGTKFSEEIKVIFSLVYITLIFILENIILMQKNKYKMKLSSVLVTIVFLQILFFKVLIDMNIFIKAYMISIIQMLIAISGYIVAKDNIKKFMGYMIPIYFIISGLVIFNIYELNYHYYMIFSLITFVLSELLQKNSQMKIKQSCFNVSYLFLVLTYLFVNVFETDAYDDVIYYILLLAVNVYIYLKTKDVKFKYISYLSFYWLFFSISEFFELYKIDNMNNIIFILCSGICCYVEKDLKIKDIFKVLIYLGSLILYNNIVENLETVEYTAIKLLGYIAVVLSISKTILKKYIDKNNLDILEAVIISIIYLMAISSYTGEYDGMLFVLLIIGVLILSYIKKYGTLFLVNIGAILVNVFLLTREFWFSIPWWIYLLIIGSILITFAIKNEADEKENKFKLMDSIKKIKDKIEE